MSLFCRPSFGLGGDEGNRTLDPLLAGQVLSQLSYTPICLGIRFVGFRGPSKLNNNFFNSFRLFSLYSRFYEDISISSRSP